MDMTGTKPAGGPQDESRAEVEFEHPPQAAGDTPARWHDPSICRRALREIGEISAVAVLPGRQMTEQKALETIAAIAVWVNTEASIDGADCGDMIRRLAALTQARDFEAMGDPEAITLFKDEMAVLSAAKR